MAIGPKWNKQRGTYYIQWKEGGRWRRSTVTKPAPNFKPGMPAPTKKPPPEAVAALAHYQAKERASQSQPAVMRQTVREFLENYVSVFALSHREGSVIMLRRVTQRFITWCEKEGVKTVADVDAGVCNRYMEQRALRPSGKDGNPLTYGGLLTERAYLQTPWSNLVKRDEITKNPWKTVTIAGRPNHVKKEHWTPEQFKTLIGVCRPWLRDVLVIGCNTGLRITALRYLEWSDIRWAPFGVPKGEYGVIVVRPELDKAKKGYEVPISRQCHDVLVERLRNKSPDHNFVVTGQAGRFLKAIRNTYDAIRRAHKTAGLGDDLKSANHAMRRTFGRWAVQGHLNGRIIPLKVVSKWFGHATMGMTEHYLDIGGGESRDWMREAETDEASAQPPAT